MRSKASLVTCADGLAPQEIVGINLPAIGSRRFDEAGEPTLMRASPQHVGALRHRRPAAAMHEIGKVAFVGASVGLVQKPPTAIRVINSVSRLTVRDVKPCLARSASEKQSRCACAWQGWLRSDPSLRRGRHCERSEHPPLRGAMDCFVALLPRNDGERAYAVATAPSATGPELAKSQPRPGAASRRARV
jgi:hypothetical protein